MKYSQSISVVVPIYNDQEVIAELHRRLKPVLEEITSHYELILVDDGSRDNSWNEMLAVRQTNPNIRSAAISDNRALLLPVCHWRIMI